MEEIQEIFNSIGKQNVSKEDKNLLMNDIIDSMDIMAIVAAIESKYKKPLNAEFIQAESFYSFETIQDMINKAMK